MSGQHIPVMKDEIVAALAPQVGEMFVDGTFGAGGYTMALLDAAPCRVIGIDRDPEALTRGQAVAARYAGRFTFLSGRFGEMDVLLARQGVTEVDGVALDLGVSSMQIDTPGRGFSFQKDGPLDMRMEAEGPSAADLVNSMAEGELADLIYLYGEERHSRRVAKAIVAGRPIRTTFELADLVRGAVRKSKDGIDPATRTFQALRIAVNDEMGELERGLAAAERILKPGGRLAVVAFHSLEDRIVKSFFKERCGQAERGSRHLPAQGASRLPSFEGAIRSFPADDEKARNPRSRSARLRAARRSDAPAWGDAA